MARLDAVIWPISLALQCGLLGLMLVRRIVVKLPVFSGLIGFYVLRAAMLSVLSGHMERDRYELLAAGLALFDVIWQVAVAWELLWAAKSDGVEGGSEARGWSGLRVLRVGLFALLLLAAAATAAVCSMSLPVSRRMPVDRGVLFPAMLFVLVWMASLRCRIPVVRRVGFGVAFYSAAAIVGQIGRALAVAHRNAAAFTAWSYVETGCYLLVVLFWIVSLGKRDEAVTGPAHPGGDILEGWRRLFT